MKLPDFNNHPAIKNLHEKMGITPKGNETMRHTQKYKIVRCYRDSYRKRVIDRGLTLEEAQAHCNDPETSSSTATGSVASSRTRRVGAWMDTYTTD